MLDRPLLSACPPPRLPPGSRLRPPNRSLPPEYSVLRVALHGPGSPDAWAVCTPLAPGFGKVQSFGAQRRRAGPGRGLAGGGTEEAGGAEGKEPVASSAGSRRRGGGVPRADVPDGTREEQQAEGGAEGEERAQGRSQRGRARA